MVQSCYSTPTLFSGPASFSYIVLFCFLVWKQTKLGVLCGSKDTRVLRFHVLAYKLLRGFSEHSYFGRMDGLRKNMSELPNLGAVLKAALHHVLVLCIFLLPACVMSFPGCLWYHFLVLCIFLLPGCVWCHFLVLCSFFLVVLCMCWVLVGFTWGRGGVS